MVKSIQLVGEYFPDRRVAIVPTTTTNPMDIPIAHTMMSENVMR
jgi:hypothetical protein